MLDFYVEKNGVRLHLADSEKVISVRGAAGIYDFYPIPASKFYISTHFDGNDMAKFTLAPGTTFDNAIPQELVPEFDPRDHIWVYGANDHVGHAFNIRRAFHRELYNLIYENIGTRAAADVCDPQHIAFAAVSAGHALMSLAVRAANKESARSLLWCGRTVYHVQTLDMKGELIASNAPAYTWSEFMVRLDNGSWEFIGTLADVLRHYTMTLQAEIRIHCTARTDQAKADDGWRDGCGLPTAE